MTSIVPSDDFVAARQTVRTFLQGWRPYAVLPPGNPSRRTLTRFVDTENPKDRLHLISEVNHLFLLHRIYAQLAILRAGANGAGAAETLLAMTVVEMAAHVTSGQRAAFAQLLQEGFSFGRHAVDAKQRAVRGFLVELFSLVNQEAGLKYTLYANGAFHAEAGMSHSEMARKFTKDGLGVGLPLGGGEFQRKEDLLFLFDTASSAFGTHLDPSFVITSVRRAIRATGGDGGKVRVEYRKKLGVPSLQAAK